MELSGKPIPRWMIALNAIIIAILLYKTWACFFRPAAIFGAAQQGYEPAHVKALWELAGRNLAMVALGIYALLRPGRTAYAAVFVLGLVREGADMVFAAGLPPDNLQSVLKASVFLIFLIPYAWALRVLGMPDLAAPAAAEKTVRG